MESHLENNSNSYRAQKEAFVSHNVGDTVFFINKVCWTAVTTYQVWQATRLQRARPSAKTAIYEFLILVVPLVLALTVFSNSPLYFNAFLYLLFAIASIYNRESTRRPARRRNESKQDELSALPNNPFHKSFVTVWRAHMMLMTVISILAVDFPAFPRSFGKTETFGTSLMDLGVGSFVFSLGLTSAPSHLKRLGTMQKPPPLLSAIKRTWIILVLGFIRLAMVKGTEYPEHVTEYGVHWNFFFTLALLPVFGALGERWSTKISFRSMALLVSLVHQVILIATPLQAYTLNDQRPNLFAQNKEGLASFAGYLAIYLLGYDTGLYVLPPDPYYLHRKDKQHTYSKPNIGKLLNVLFSYAVVWWAAYGVLHLALPAKLDTSRRLANSAYVLWVTAFNVSFLFLYLAVDAMGDSVDQSDPRAGPLIFRALNKNSLAIFLLANLLTGLINVSMKTMYASDAVAVAVLIGYSSVLIAFAYKFRHIRMKL